MSAFEDARPTTGLDLITVATGVLAAVVAFFTANGVALPDRQYVTAGDPAVVAWDCEQLTVCLDEVGWGRSADATQLSPSFGKQASVNAMRHVTYAVLLVRCVPTIEDEGELPTPAALTASGAGLFADAGLLSQALVNFVAFRDASLPPGGAAQAGAVQMLGPQGGLVGVSGGLIVTAATTTDPAMDAPLAPHLAIRNGTPGGGL